MNGDDDDMEKKKPGYFEEALSDFTHDAASGGAIRHMVDLGYSADQIIQRLDFPTPRARVEKTICQYMIKTGMLLESLPSDESSMQKIILKNPTPAQLSAHLAERIRLNEEANSYIACPFGTIRRDREARMQRLLSSLTSREKEYILGIPWKPQIMYHRLNGRMREAGIQLALHTGIEWKFYFLKSHEIICVPAKSNALY